MEGEEPRPRKQTRTSRRKSNKAADTPPQPTPQEGVSTQRDTEEGSTQRGVDGRSTQRGVEERPQTNGTRFSLTLPEYLPFLFGSLADSIPLPPSPPSANHYLNRLEALKTYPPGILDKEGPDLDDLFVPGGIEMTPVWEATMERVARETKEAYAQREEDGTWFFPEYYAFKERREFFFSSCTWFRISTDATSADIPR